MSLEPGGAWELANTGGHSQLTNWASPGKFGRGSSAHGFLRLKSILGRATPLLTQTRGDQGLGGRRVRRGGSGKRPAQAARPLQRWSARLGPVPRSGSRFYEDGCGVSGTPAQPGQTSPRVAVRPSACLSACTRSGFPGGTEVKNPPPNKKMQVQSLGQAVFPRDITDFWGSIEGWGTKTNRQKKITHSLSVLRPAPGRELAQGDGGMRADLAASTG